ncbi:DoxX family membrane protein [Flavobacterium silvaticum]|uniref:DoxX family membrane protein n=1 Tax=Flavobacterium silvaticum TaxID=1852020 RepID=A0A972JGT1_9FLAO|nr:DoxX family membrane protein [Flavobacterium silvaticum]NMH27210.1 DoxX family membrane protein [Flavobacterium silvaticum]
MKIAAVIVRLLLGAMYVFASVSFFLMNPADMPKMEGAIQKVNEGFGATVYLFPLVKVLELLCGLSLVTGFFVPLSAVVILPITINIFLYHCFLTPSPDQLVVPALMLIANIFILIHKRDHYKAIFVK